MRNDLVTTNAVSFLWVVADRSGKHLYAAVQLMCLVWTEQSQRSELSSNIQPA